MSTSKIVIGVLAAAAIYGAYKYCKAKKENKTNPEFRNFTTGAASCLPFCAKHCDGQCTQTCSGNRCTCHCRKKLLTDL